MDAERCIEQLLYRYAERLDAGDFDGVAALFRHADITSGAGPGVSGEDAVRALYHSSTRLYPDGTPRTQHVISNPLITVTGDTARAHSRFTVFQQTDDFPLQPIIAGFYRDTFARENGEWFFTQRDIAPTLIGDLSRHLLIDLPEDA